MKKLVFVSFIFLTACFGEVDTSDLEVFVADTTAKPKGRIKPLPEFQPYSSFVYGASGLRSPFESPVAYSEVSNRVASMVEPPDSTRRKEALERYPLGELSLVGTLSREEDDLPAALIRTTGGSVHVAGVGQYMGKNHGRILNISDTQLDLMEVVPNGSGGWISRPHSMGLNESAGDGK